MHAFLRIVAALVVGSGMIFAPAAAQVGENRYSVTVVDFRESERIHAEMEKTEAASGANAWINDQRASVARAARQFRQRGGEVTYDAWSHIDLVEGRICSTRHPGSAEK